MEVNIDSSGQGDHDLIMLHGWGFNAAVWKECLPWLEDHFRLHCVDLPGYGDSDMLQPYTLENIAQELIERLPQNASWLGWSLGGLVAMSVAAKLQQEMKRLILVASTPRFTSTGDWPHAVRKKVFDDFSQQLEQDYLVTLKRFMLLQVMNSREQRATMLKLNRIMGLEHQDFSNGVLQQGLQLLLHTDLRETCRQIRIPVSIILGQQDQLVPAAVGRDWQQLIGQAEVHIIDKAGHAPFLSHAQEFAARLKAPYQQGQSHAV